jgi:hypothetical protein
MIRGLAVVLLWAMAGLILTSGAGCGKKVDTSHREDPNFNWETATDPAAIMPGGMTGAPGKKDSPPKGN